MASTDFNMLRLEAPRDMLQITDGTEPTEEALEVTNPATWLRALVKQQKQAERDLAQLVGLCGNTIDHNDQKIRQIEQAYLELSEGTRYVYDRLSANEKITGEWIRSELASAATAYQAFAQNVWGAIIERTQEAADKQAGQAAQLARLNDSISFLAEANVARSQHLANFQGNVEIWANEHQNRVEFLEERLLDARQETRRQADALQQLAAQIQIPKTPPPRPSRQASPKQTAWRSPALPSTSSLASVLRRLHTAPTEPTRPIVPPRPDRRIRRPALSPPAPARSPMLEGGGTPPRPPRRPLPPPPSPSPPPSPDRQRRSPTPARRTLTTEELARMIARAVAEGVAGTVQPNPAPPAVRTARLKMTNPEAFDGKPTTPFDIWWKSVTKYLSFYPETNDQQKIAWIGTLLTGTAKAWDLHRYDTVGENDTWINYSAAIRSEYHDPQEAANAQLRIGQIRYSGDIRAYLTEFRALNNYAKVTGESLQEKVNMAMPDSVLIMRFAHYLGEFVDDDDFLEATYQAALQVEMKKALKAAKEATRITAPAAGKKDDKKEGKKENQRPREPRDEEKGRSLERRSQYGKPRHWNSKDEAMKGVPPREQEEYFKNPDDCWRCGQNGHRTYECFAHATRRGTTLPPAPWKVSAVSEGKRKRDEEETGEPPAAKLQKVAAVEAMETDVPLWEESDSDF